MSVYEVQVVRDGRWWLVTVPAIGGVTQARRFTDVEAMARELVAVTTGDADAEVRLGEVKTGDVAVSDRINRIRSDRAEAARLERQASEEVRALAREIAAQGVSLRDVGAVLGVSHQRAHQLISG